MFLFVLYTQSLNDFIAPDSFCRYKYLCRSFRIFVLAFFRLIQLDYLQLFQIILGKYLLCSFLFEVIFLCVSSVDLNEFLK